MQSWADYETGLQRRGALTVWLSKTALKGWRAPATGRPWMRAPSSSRSLVGQRIEVSLACKILNTMTDLGMPDSVRVR